MSTRNITRSQIFTVVATSFAAGLFVQNAVDHLDKGNTGIALLDLAAVAMNAAAAIILAIRIFRAMPASA